MVGGGFGDLSCGFSYGCGLLGLNRVVGLVLFLHVFFRWCSSGGVVGFGWWLCGVLGLFTTVRESGGRETEIKEKRYIILGNIFYCVDILF